MQPTPTSPFILSPQFDVTTAVRISRPSKRIFSEKSVPRKFGGWKDKKPWSAPMGTCSGLAADLLEYFMCYDGQTPLQVRKICQTQKVRDDVFPSIASGRPVILKRLLEKEGPYELQNKQLFPHGASFIRPQKPSCTIARSYRDTR